MYLFRIFKYVKGLKYYILIDLESYFLLRRSLRVFMLYLINWGGGGIGSQELLWGRFRFCFQVLRFQGVEILVFYGKVWSYDIRLSIIWVLELFFEGILVFRFDKNREIFQKENRICVYMKNIFEKKFCYEIEIWRLWWC